MHVFALDHQLRVFAGSPALTAGVFESRLAGELRSDIDALLVREHGMKDGGDVSKSGPEDVQIRCASIQRRPAALAEVDFVGENLCCQLGNLAWPFGKAGHRRQELSQAVVVKSRTGGELEGLLIVVASHSESVVFFTQLISLPLGVIYLPPGLDHLLKDLVFKLPLFDLETLFVRGCPVHALYFTVAWVVVMRNYRFQSFCSRPRPLRLLGTRRVRVCTSRFAERSSCDAPREEPSFRTLNGCGAWRARCLAVCIGQRRAITQSNSLRYRR